MTGRSRWLAVLVAGAVLGACHADRPVAAKPSLWLETMTSSVSPTPWVRRECLRPRQRPPRAFSLLRPIFSLLPHPCTVAANRTGDGRSLVNSSCKLPSGTVVTAVSETSAGGRSIHTRTVFQHPGEAATWDDTTSVRLGDCPVAMRPDQSAIWIGPDGKWTDDKQEQQRRPGGEVASRVTRRSEVLTCRQPRRSSTSRRPIRPT